MSIGLKLGRKSPKCMECIRIERNSRQKMPNPELILQQRDSDHVEAIRYNHWYNEGYDFAADLTDTTSHEIAIDFADGRLRQSLNE